MKWKLSAVRLATRKAGMEFVLKDVRRLNFGQFQQSIKASSDKPDCLILIKLHWRP